MMKAKDVIVSYSSPPAHSRLLFHIVQFEMQLQGTVPIERGHITKQHGGTVFTERNYTLCRCVP